MLWTPTHTFTNEEYHAHPAHSRSALRQIERSPLHFWHNYLNPDRQPAEPTPAMRFGILVHMAVLEPELFLQTYDIGPDAAKTTKTWKGAQAAADRELLTVAEAAQVEGIHKALYSHPAAAKALRAPGINEATFIAADPATGLNLKCRPDRLTESGWVVDLKTTQDASAAEFSKSVANFGYHVQAAFYLHVLEITGGKRPRGFIFVAVEKSAPYAVQVFRCSADLIDTGNRRMHDQLAQLRHCYDTLPLDAPWPTYNQEPVELSLPRWAT